MSCSCTWLPTRPYASKIRAPSPLTSLSSLSSTTERALSANMTRIISLALALVALNSPTSVLGAPNNYFEPRAGGVCGSGIYGELAPIIAGYPIAQSFCTAVYPVSCTTPKAVKRAASTVSFPNAFPKNHALTDCLRTVNNHQFSRQSSRQNNYHDNQDNHQGNDNNNDEENHHNYHYQGDHEC